MMVVRSQASQGSDEQLNREFVEDLLSFTGESNLEDVVPDHYSFEVEGRGVAPDTRVSDDHVLLGLVEDIVNHEEAIVARLLEENDVDMDEFDSPSEVFDEYGTGDERMELRAFDSELDHTRTFASYDNGIGMTGEEAARYLATAHDSGTDKRDNQLFQGGHGKGSLAVIGSSDVVVVLTTPTDSDRLYAVVITVDDKDTKVLRDENGDIPSIRLDSAIEMYGEKFFEDSGTMVRMVNYDMLSKKDCPRLVTGDGFVRRLGHRIARVHSLKLIDMIDESEREFIGSYNTARNSMNAFSDDVCFDLFDGSCGLDLEVEAFVQKPADVRDELFEDGKLDRCHAGQKSKNKGTKMKDLLGTQSPPVRFICKSSVHETLSHSWLDGAFDNIDEDILVFVKCEGNDQLFDSRRDSLTADKATTRIKDKLGRELRKSETLRQADKKRANYVDEKADRSDDSDDDGEVPVNEIAEYSLDELRELDGKASRKMERIVKYWYNQPYLKLEEAAENGIRGAEIALRIVAEYGLGQELEMVHNGNDYSGSVGDIAILNEESGEVVEVIELKISEYGGDGTRFNVTTDLLHIAGVFGRRAPERCTDIRGGYDENIEEELRKYHYPSRLSTSGSAKSVRKDRARYLRDEVLDEYDEEQVVENPSEYEENVVEAALIKNTVEFYGHRVIKNCIEELTDEAFEVDNDRLKALFAFLTAGIHTEDHIRDAMAKFRKGEDVREIINSNYSVAKIHIDDEEVSCKREDTMSLVDKILDSEIVIKPPSEKENGEICKYLEIGCKSEPSAESEEYHSLFRLQFNWRNVFQGVSSFSIEGMEGEFFREYSDD